jgi:predicted chitinase
MWILLLAVGGCGVGAAPRQTSPASLQKTQVGIYLATLNTGQFLSADNGGGGVITATAPWMRGWEHFSVHDTSNAQLTDGDLVYVAASSGQFLSANNGGGGALTATAPWQRSWEAFYLVRLGGSGAIQDGDSIALKTLLKGNYVSADNGGGGAVSASAPWARAWETFVITVDGSGGTGGGTTPLQQVLSQSQFESMFPYRNGFYSYDNFIQAAKGYPGFAASGTLDDRKREVAAFLANVNHETGGLVAIDEYVKELRCTEGDYACPCAYGQLYYGRGPLQITGNENYCAASAAILGDPSLLDNDPERVSRDAALAWATALWFWTATDCHDDIVNNEDFAATIQTINGPYECGGANPNDVQDRVDAYLSFCQMLGVDSGNSLYC